jgi:hypothetical protein
MKNSTGMYIMLLVYVQTKTLFDGAHLHLRSFTVLCCCMLGGWFLASMALAQARTAKANVANKHVRFSAAVFSDAVRPGFKATAVDHDDLIRKVILQLKHQVQTTNLFAFQSLGLKPVAHEA